jgi:hypothetical protein
MKVQSYLTLDTHDTHDTRTGCDIPDETFVCFVSSRMQLATWTKVADMRKGADWASPDATVLSDPANRDCLDGTELQQECEHPLL